SPRLTAPVVDELPPVLLEHLAPVLDRHDHPLAVDAERYALALVALPETLGIGQAQLDARGERTQMAPDNAARADAMHVRAGRLPGGRRVRDLAAAAGAVSAPVGHPVGQRAPAALAAEDALQDVADLVDSAAIVRWHHTVSLVG